MFASGQCGDLFLPNNNLFFTIVHILTNNFSFCSNCT